MSGRLFVIVGWFIMPHHSYSLQTMYSFYLMRSGDVVVERPQFLYMRVAVAIHGRDIDRVLSTYQLLSLQAYTPATPMICNAGVLSQHLVSSFMYHPPLGTAVVIANHSVADLGAFWTSDGGVGMNIGAVPASEFVLLPVASYPGCVAHGISGRPIPLGLPVQFPSST